MSIEMDKPKKRKRLRLLSPKEAGREFTRQAKESFKELKTNLGVRKKKNTVTPNEDGTVATNEQRGVKSGKLKRRK